MNVDLDVQYAIADDDGEPPSPALIRTWVMAALNGQRDEAELTVRIVTAKEIQKLNRNYRHKDKPTNVLSFPFEKIEGINLPLLGDVVVCATVIAHEAQQQNKFHIDHWAHMVVHGVLHLLGHDHVDEAEAETMERLEIKILKGLAIGNPYGFSPSLPINQK